MLTCLHLPHRANPNPNPNLRPRVGACSDPPPNWKPATAPDSPSLRSAPSKLGLDRDRRPWRSSLLASLLPQTPPGHGTFSTADVVAGCISLAVAAASVAAGLGFAWKKAAELASLPPRYELVVEFPLASGITAGTPVKLRGVNVGSVIHVRPCLERIDTHIQVLDSSVYIPRNAVIEVNQSGLAGETMIDIMPMIPVPHPSVGPLHPDCPDEGLIVCDKQSIRGKQGVSMDDLIGICGKMVRNSEDGDTAVLLKNANQLIEVIDNCKPLFQRTEAFLNDSQAMIEALRNNGVLQDLTEFLQLLTHTTYNMRKSYLRTEDGPHFSEELARLATRLKNLEDNLKNASTFMGDDQKQREIKHLIEILSRLVNA